MTIPLFDLPDLRAKELASIVALAEYGSFVAAAAHLKTSQPALTRTVKRVERALGVELFTRSTRRVEITQAGKEFVAVAARVLHDLQHSVRSMTGVSRDRAGAVTISTFSGFAVRTMPDVVCRYRQTRPAVEIRVREGSQTEVIEDVRNGVADVGVSYVDALPDNLSAEALVREPICAMIPSGHALARRKRLRLIDLHDAELIGPPGGSFLRRQIDPAAADSGCVLRYGVLVDRLISIVAYVRAGAGIGLVPAGVLPPRPWKGFEVCELTDPALAVSVGLITLPGKYLTPPVVDMVALIREAMRPPVP
jgi:DNA-binding transcriptional LysR family regulator